MLRKSKTALVVVTAAAMLAAAAPAASAQPHWYGGPGYHGHWHGHRGGHWDNGRWIAPLVGGMIIGGLAAEAARPRYAYNDHDAYCHARFRTYNSYTGTYTGYDGLQHRC